MQYFTQGLHDTFWEFYHVCSVRMNNHTAFIGILFDSHCFWTLLYSLCCFRSPWFVFPHSFNAFDKHLYTCIPKVIYKMGWSIRSGLSDYILFSFYKSDCRHDIYWILVAFVIAASALIKVSRLYGLYRHLCTQLINWYCAVILHTHVTLLNNSFWILNPESMHILYMRAGIVMLIMHGI